MTKRRERYSAQFKSGIALEPVKGPKTISQIASEQGVHPSQISQGKKQLLTAGLIVFNSASARKQREQEAQEAGLYDQIRRLEMELGWLKKKAARRSCHQPPRPRQIA
jgi:putative transposase